MPATPATTFQEVIDFACRNVWTKFNAATNIKAQLLSWKAAAFSIENGGSPLPIGVLLWDPVTLNTANGIPTPQTAIDPHKVVCAIQQVTFAFRDNPSVASTEAAFVAAFNTFWS